MEFGLGDALGFPEMPQHLGVGRRPDPVVSVLVGGDEVAQGVQIQNGLGVRLATPEEFVDHRLGGLKLILATDRDDREPIHRDTPEGDRSYHPSRRPEVTQLRSAPAVVTYRLNRDSGNGASVISPYPSAQRLSTSISPHRSSAPISARKSAASLPDRST